jgi:signal transduction histidine kinase
MTGRWTLARRLAAATLGFALVLGLGIATIGVTLRMTHDAVQDETDRISPARQAGSDLLTALVNQETALRGYALGRDREFLQPYEQGRVRERVLRSRLHELVGTRQPSAADLQALELTIDTWRTRYQQPRLADLQAAGPDAIDVRLGRALFDQVRAASAVLDRELSAETRSAKRHITWLTQVVVVVLAAVSALVLLALALLLMALRRWVTRPLGALRTQVTEVASGSREQSIQPSGPPDLVALGEDVERMREELVAALAEVEHARLDIERRSLELARSNADLEQFAYVASHDLQEPLRKVASFCQLLEQRYRDQLDDRGVQYIDFAVDGAKRMQRLINDLLTFSRVGRSSAGFVPVELTDVVSSAWAAVGQRVEESGAQLEQIGPSPTVLGDASLLHLLLQNLLGNALKYRRPDLPPVVRVTTAETDGEVTVTVEDNGIGIPPEYAEKVFVIFQRLHGRDEYEGTGIGLALCKKVVEFHGGEIGLTGSALGGAGITFTLPLWTEPSVQEPALEQESLAS